MKSERHHRGNLCNKRGGFSLIELLVVLAVCLILTAIGRPIFKQFSYNVRLRSAASNISGLMQQARMRAARQNAIYTIGYRAVAGGEQAYIDLDNSNSYDPGEPVITMSATITPSLAAPGTPFVLVGDTAGVVYTNNTVLGYSPRGLPCAYAAGACPTPAAGYFVYYFTDQRDVGVGWAAVLVTRTGRTKALVWSGTSWQ
jgi:prepilin-type N-terminal cleavage/methylation domain-containing protein